MKIRNLVGDLAHEVTSRQVLRMDARLPARLQYSCASSAEQLGHRDILRIRAKKLCV
jgi:hypothetical protein